MGQNKRDIKSQKKKMMHRDGPLSSCHTIAKLIQENEFEFDAINMGKFHSQINVKHAAMQHFSQTTLRTYQDRE